MDAIDSGGRETRFIRPTIYPLTQHLPPTLLPTPNLPQPAAHQVYLPRGKGTQTRKEQGTNPPRNLTYFAGLRSTPGIMEPASAVVQPSKFTEGELGRGPAVLNLQFEL